MKQYGFKNFSKAFKSIPYFRLERKESKAKGMEAFKNAMTKEMRDLYKTMKEHQSKPYYYQPSVVANMVNSCYPPALTGDEMAGVVDTYCKKYEVDLSNQYQKKYNLTLVAYLRNPEFHKAGHAPRSDKMRMKEKNPQRVDADGDVTMGNGDMGSAGNGDVKMGDGDNPYADDI